MRPTHQEENIAHGGSVRRDEEPGRPEGPHCLREGFVAMHLPDLPVALRSVIARRERVEEQSFSIPNRSKRWREPPSLPSSASMTVVLLFAAIHSRLLELQLPMLGIVIEEDELLLLSR